MQQNDAAKKKSAIQVALAGIAMQVVGFLANGLTLGLESQRLASMFALLISLGSAVVVWGCIRLAVAKGKPWYLGLLGLFSVVGVAILALGVRDRAPAAAS